MDIEATDHITVDPFQLATVSTYEGTDQFQMGNGENLLISHTG